MEISSIGSNSIQSSLFSSLNKTKMTDEEKSTVAEILSQYDTENLSAADQKEMMEALKDSGIKPSKELFAMIKDAGFEIAPPPSPPEELSVASVLSGDNSIDSTTDLSSLLEKYQSGEITEDELRTQLQQMLPIFSARATGNLFNIEA